VVELRFGIENYRMKKKALADPFGGNMPASRAYMALGRCRAWQIESTGHLVNETSSVEYRDKARESYNGDCFVLLMYARALLPDRFEEVSPAYYRRRRPSWSSIVCFGKWVASLDEEALPSISVGWAEWIASLVEGGDCRQVQLAWMDCVSGREATAVNLQLAAVLNGLRRWMTVGCCIEQIVSQCYLVDDETSSVEYRDNETERL
jgi:hypothetical protein